MRVAGVMVAVLVLSAAIALADKGGKGNKHGRSGEGDEASVTVVFGARERDAAHGYFVERHGRGNCPPGLAKKHDGCLPPGQAKKRYAVGRPLPRGIVSAPLPRELAVRVGPAPRGYLYVMLDGDLLKLAAGTMMVVDAIQGLVD